MSDKLPIKITLPPDWHTETVRPGVDPGKPGIYEWVIEGAGSYIGQYSHHSRPREEYGVNVVRLLNRRPYRKENPEGFRRVHWALAAAIVARRRVELVFLENAEKPAINDRERALIGERGTLNGPAIT